MATHVHRGPFKWWFHLTKEERALVLMIAAIALVGLTARTCYLRAEQSTAEQAITEQR